MSNQRRFALIGRGFGSDSFDEAVQDIVGALLVDSSEIDFTYTDATPSITAALKNASVVFARLQNFDALSVLGRAANSSGVGDEIAASANDRLLRRTSDTLNFGQLTAGMFPNTVVPDAALSSNVPLLNAANVFTSRSQFITATGVTSSFWQLSADSSVGYFGISDASNAFIVGDSAGDVGIVAKAGNILFSRDDGASIVAKIGSSLANSSINGVAFSDFARLSQNNVFTSATQRITGPAALARWIMDTTTGGAGDEAYHLFSIGGSTKAFYGTAPMFGAQTNSDFSVSITSGNFAISCDASTSHFRVSVPASGETSLWVYDSDNATLERVSVGAAGSGGTGFKVLRIPD